MHLLPLMRKSVSARVINVSTNGHVFGQINLSNINLRNGAYTAISAHLQTKLALVLFAREMATRLGGKDSNVKTYAINPGIVNSRPAGNIVGDFFKALLTLSIEMGPQTYLYCALDEALDNESGFYYEYVF
jgi:NAD(P)-dependent dehydrogenase (short-subunit alcohol dehydrogenase family)